MKSAVLLLTLTLAAFSAAAFETGQFTPLTNTRYGAVAAYAMTLATDGADPYLFFAAGDTVRMRRIADGPAQPARVILDGVYGTPAVVWTGSHFFVAALGPYPYGVAATIVDRNGLAVRPQWLVRDRDGTAPHLAFNGRIVLLLSGAVAMALDPSGSVLAQSPFPRGYEASVAVASNGTEFAATVHDGFRRLLYRFDADGKPELPAASVAIGNPYGFAAMASDGRDYLLAVQDIVTQTLKAVRLPAEGGIGQVLTSERSVSGGELHNLALAWRGDAYAITYRERYAPELRAFTVDRNGDALTGHEVIAPVNTESYASLVSVRGQALLAWNTSDAWKVGVRELQTNSETTSLVSHSALDQVLQATAPSSTGTLFVWREDGMLRSGLRTNAGEWRSDQSLDIYLNKVLLASNGSEFLLVGQDKEAWVAVRLSALGKPLAAPVKLGDNNVVGFDGITWHRQRYLVVGRNPNEIVAFTVDPSLAVTGPIRLNGFGYYASVVSDGTNAMAVWLQSYGQSLVFTRLGPQFQVLDSTPRKIAEAPYFSINAAVPLAWDGRHYLVGWRAYAQDAIHIAHIDRDGQRAGIDIDVPAFGEGRTFAYTSDIAILAAGGTLGVSWYDSSAAVASTQFRLLRNGHIFLEQSWDAPVPLSRPHLVRAGDRLGLAMSLPHNDAPYHGAGRVMLAMTEVAPRELPELPGAPALTARTTDSDSVTLTWTAPAEPTNGYRIESRIEGGPWKEIEHWFAANATTATLRLLFPGARVAFRMRALNDAGAGAYSNDAPASSPRRRAVR